MLLGISKTSCNGSFAEGSSAVGGSWGPSHGCVPEEIEAVQGSPLGTS